MMMSGMTQKTTITLRDLNMSGYKTLRVLKSWRKCGTAQMKTPTLNCNKFLASYFSRVRTLMATYLGRSKSCNKPSIL
jgi:hypothetical protein